MIAKIKFKDIKMKFALNRHSDYSSSYQVFVENSYPNLLRLLNDGDTVIDAGANAGVFTVMASYLVGESGRIIAIEPDPENLATLKKNIEINGLKNVDIVEKALFSESNQVIDLISNGTKSHVVTEDTDHENPFKIFTVNTITFDDLLLDLSISPAFLKMDIEGSEKYALRCADHTMGFLRYIECEIHDFDSERELLRYKCFRFGKTGAENIENVKGYLFRHPFKVANMEIHNSFLTSRRVLFARSKRAGIYPKLFFGQKVFDNRTDGYDESNVMNLKSKGYF